MRYEILILATSIFNFYQCSEIKNELGSTSLTQTKLDYLFPDVLYQIVQYLDLPHRHLSRVDKYLNKVFKEELSYKVFLSRQLNIPEIKNIEEENFTELLAIGTLVRFKDPLHVFKAIRHGLIKLNEFPSASVPLAKYLTSFYKKADQEEKLRLDSTETFVDDLSDYLIERDHFDLVIKLQLENPTKVFKRFLSFERFKSLLFQTSINENIKMFYIDCLMESNAQLLIKIVHFNLISATPEIFGLTIEIMRKRINDKSVNNLSHLKEFQRMLDFIIEFYNEPISSEYFNILNNDQLTDLFIMATLADKMDLVLELRRNPELTQVFMGLFHVYRNERNLKLEDAKVFFDLFLNNFSGISLFKIELLKILTKFYYFKNIKFECGTLFIDFEASDQLVEDLRFPKEVKFEHFSEGSYFTMISGIWDEMKVKNLTMFKEFFKSYLNLPDIIHHNNVILTGSKVIKLFAQDEELVELALSVGLKLVLCNDNEESLLLQETPVVGFNRAVDVTNKLTLLTSAKNDNELHLVEEIISKDVSQIILDHFSYEDLIELTEDDYFELRHALKYWVKMQDSMTYDISRMESDIILGLLNKEI